MTYIEKLRAALNEKSGALDAVIKSAEDEGRALTAEEKAKVDDIEKEIDEIVASIEIATRSEARRAAESLPSNTPVENQPNQIRTHAAPAQRLTAVQRMGLMAMAVTASAFATKDSLPETPLKILDDNGFGELANSAEQVTKRKKELMRTLNVSTNVSGGFLTPDNQASDIIELLYPETTFLQGNPRTVNMPDGTYRQPAGASGSTASYRQEGEATSVTEPTFREVNLSSKFLGAIVPMTRQMIDFTLPGAESFVQMDLREAMGQTMDAKAYYGAGAQGEPQGLLTSTGITTVTTPAAAPTLAQIDSFFRAMRLALLNNNIRGGRWAYVMSPRTLEFLQIQRDGNGNYAYPETRGATPMMGNVRILFSTQFPINLDTSGNGNGDETDIALINFSDVLLGTQGDIAMATSSEATININGTMVSAFQNDLVFLRALSAHDIGLRRPESVAVSRSIRWGN